MSQYEVTFAGFGGQGIMTAGQLLAYAGIAEGKQVVWLPSYGPEMRGGTAYCTVVISENKIGSPVINNPRAVCVFNRPSFDKFEPRVKSGGLIIVNSSLIDVESTRDDLTQLLIPANDLAMENENPKASNIAVLAAFVAASEVVSHDGMKNTIIDKMGKKKQFLEKNLQVFDEGYNLALKQLGKKEKT